MEPRLLCIDTDVIIDHLRGRSDVLETVLAHFDCALTAITAYELLLGLAHAPRQSALFNDLLDLVQVLPFDLKAAREAARIDAQLRTQGTPIGLPDTLIAGICIAYGVPLLTRNTAHYKRVEGLTVIRTDQLPR